MEWQYNLNDIHETASRVLIEAGEQKLIVFNGQMGAGKTTLIQALCFELGVKERVSSPTFSIINEYQSAAMTIYHIDLYRCKNEEEAIRAGVEECLYSGNFCFVEWPSVAPDIFPPLTWQVSLELVNESTRKIIVNDISAEELKHLSRM